MSNKYGQERRSTDAQIGYLTGRIEAIEFKVDEHIVSEEKFVSKLETKLDKMAEAIEWNSRQLSMYSHFIFFTKALLACIAALMAFNWQEAKAAWSTFFGPFHH